MYDNIFIKRQIEELKIIKNTKVFKVNFINDSDFYLVLNIKTNLLISIKNNHLRLTSLTLEKTTQLTNFNSVLRKYLESSIILNIEQFNDDRVIIISFHKYDELGYKKLYKLVIEFFGRNANLIILDENDIIIDCLKRLLEEENKDAILPKYKYQFKKKEISYSKIIQTSYEIKTSLPKTKPLLITTSSKTIFYCFDLPNLEGERKEFDTLSNLLDYYYTFVIKNNTTSFSKQKIINYINKEITKNKTKISKLKNDLELNKSNLEYLYTGNLIKSNMHIIKKGMSEVSVCNFYNNNVDLTINLDPLLTPQQNMQFYFNKYQKAKRAIDIIENQINLTYNDLKYYECLLNQVEISKSSDENEFLSELNLVKKTNKSNKKTTPNYKTYKLNDESIVMVGKNNIQNNYITHKLAKPNDYFFHVENAPGSHVILKTTSLTSYNIELTAMIASLYSTLKDSTKVSVNYTPVKNIKKVPGVKGSFVIYKEFKTVIISIDEDYIKNNTN